MCIVYIIDVDPCRLQKNYLDKGKGKKINFYLDKYLFLTYRGLNLIMIL